MQWRKLIINCSSCLGLGGCGGSAPTTPLQPILTSIVVSPSSASAELPATQQFRVMTSPAYWNGNVPEQRPETVRPAEWELSTNPLSVTLPNGQTGLTVSAKGSQNGILWSISVVGGLGAVLDAYNATNLTELYDSNQDQARDFVGGAVTFQAPLVVNGKVYVGAQDQLTSTACFRNSGGVMATDKTQHVFNTTREKLGVRLDPLPEGLLRNHAPVIRLEFSVEVIAYG